MLSWIELEEMRLPMKPVDPNEEATETPDTRLLAMMLLWAIDAPPTVLSDDAISTPLHRCPGQYCPNARCRWSCPGPYYRRMRRSRRTMSRSGPRATRWTR